MKSLLHRECGDSYVKEETNEIFSAAHAAGVETTKWGIC
jgi:hypothetical protein